MIFRTCMMNHPYISPLNISYDAVAANINSESKLLQLMMRDGEKNIYKQIADLIEKPQDDTTESFVKTDRKAILQAVEGIIKVETPSAENEFDSYESLKKNFYPLKEYKYIFDNSKFIITGSKGSGKTALLQVLSCERYAKEMAEYIGIPEREVSFNTWLVGLDATEEFPDKANFRAIGRMRDTEYYLVYWKILAVRTLKEIIKQYKISGYAYLEEIFPVNTVRLSITFRNTAI